jgi:ADP-dependent NAD(P)H-hydrate dehydratase / NAD(P)H-hydrate epimerase
MKIVTGETMQAMDRRTIEKFGISGLDLMERAGQECSDVILHRFGNGLDRCAVILAGKGNNGGDGYVIARHLTQAGWRVTTLVLSTRDEISGDARANLDLLTADCLCFCPGSGELALHLSIFSRADLIIDALFGTGLKSEVRGIYAEAVELINGMGLPVVSVDIPSGIDAGTGRVLGCAVRADLTVSFALAKLGLILYPGAAYCGELQVVDIGIPPEVSAAVDGFEYLDAFSVKPLLRKRERFAHKGSFGHCLVVAGSTGKTGAAAMTANSAVRSGAGLVTLAVPASLNAILEVKTTEPMTLPVPDGDAGYLTDLSGDMLVVALAGKSAVALGPGLSLHEGTVSVVRRLMSAAEIPLVIDADGLNALAQDPSLLLGKRPSTVILTPHPGEMARLAGITVADVEADRIATARSFSSRYGVYLVLKGARTVIAAPDGRIAINGSGNPGMASGGMGDVLTGILVALLGQAYDPFTVCRLGVYIHGAAADLVAAEKGEIGISAEDVQESIPCAFHKLAATA